VIGAVNHETRLVRLFNRKRVKADQMMKINLLDDIKTMDKTQGAK